MTKEKIKILVVPANDGGCSYYRAIMPFEKLQQHCGEEVEIRFDKNPLNWNTETNIAEEISKDMEWCDVIMTQNISNFGPSFMVELFKAAMIFTKNES